MPLARVPSDSPEAFQCSACGYDLRALVPLDELVQCSECGKTTPESELGTVPEGRPFAVVAGSLFGPTAVCGLIMMIAVATASGYPLARALAFVAFIASVASVALAPPIAAPMMVRGSCKGWNRFFRILIVILGAWLLNFFIFMFFVLVTGAIAPW